MKKLPVDTNEMYGLYQKGFSAAEVAAEFGIKVATVKWRFKAAGLPMRSQADRTDRWYENVANAKARNNTWTPSRVEEMCFAEALRQGVRPERNFVVGKYAIDLAFPEKKIAIEIDGRFHTQEVTRARDQVRDAYLHEHGWQVHRIPITGLMTGANKIPTLLLKLGLITKREPRERTNAQTLDRPQIRALRAEGLGFREIARRMGCSHQAVIHICEQE